MQKKEKYSEIFLIQQLICGNENAFKEIYNKYHQDIYAYGISILKSKESAKEIVQDVFLKVWQHRDKLNPELSFKSYLFTITRNTSFNLISKLANEKKLKKHIMHFSEISFNHVEQRMNEIDYEKIKNNAIEQLSPKRKIIFQLSRNEGLSHKEISDKLDISISTVKGQMNKSLKAIRKFISANSDISFLL